MEEDGTGIVTLIVVRGADEGIEGIGVCCLGAIRRLVVGVCDVCSAPCCAGADVGAGAIGSGGPRTCLAAV